MIIYVNGDSHSAGAEAVNSYCFAEDDYLYRNLGRQPHPDNIQASYGCLIANELGAVLQCDAESASSNERIVRTTWPNIQSVQDSYQVKPNLVIIGWSTWEREEWVDQDGTYHQVTAGGTDSVPVAFLQRYQEWVINQDEVARERKMLYWHNRIWDLHIALQNKNIPHIFFNTYSDFSAIRLNHLKTGTVNPGEREWGLNYVDPYDRNLTYYNWCIQRGFKTVKPTSYHFGADAHRAWAEFLMQYYVQMLLTGNE